MSKALVHLVGGARPNFMKLAPIVRALQARSDRFELKIVHTGQHYDRDMSDVFFEELGIPAPDHYLDAGGGSHAQQTAKIMVAYETLCQERLPDLTLVVGDVNSTIACSLVAKKLGVAVAHVEAGLRSGDRNMPEEINRLATDAISDYFFVTEESGEQNLLREGQPANRVFFVGHVMIDNLFYQVEQLKTADHVGFPSAALKQRLQRYGIVTLHRPSNVDSADTLVPLVGALKEIAAELPLIFPVHPRTRGNIERFGIDLGPNIHTTAPMSYMDFLNVWKDAAVVLTDSGGLQEETTGLGVPCLTLRENTERPVTLSDGTNTLVGVSPAAILEEARKVLQGQGKAGRQPKYWDGHAAERIVAILDRELP